MAHGNQCTGKWRDSKLGGNPDGIITINDHNTNQITGTHEDTGFPISGTCHDGNSQEFTRKKDNMSNKKIHYKGDITVGSLKTHIKGKFSEENGVNEREAKHGKKADAPPADDWTAEKQT